MFDDSISSIQPEGYLINSFNEMVCTFINTGNPQFFNRFVGTSRGYFISSPFF
jgi:hypothetical protein